MCFFLDVAIASQKVSVWCCTDPMVHTTSREVKMLECSSSVIVGHHQLMDHQLEGRSRPDRGDIHGPKTYKLIGACDIHDPKYGSFFGLAGPGGPGRTSKMCRAKPPTFVEAFPDPRGLPDFKNEPKKIRPECLQVPRHGSITTSMAPNPINL